MARRIRAADRVDIAAPAERVFAILADAQNYPRWWPPALRVRIVETIAGQEIDIHPPGGGCRCRLGAADPPHRLVVDYIAGPQRGLGVWTLAAKPDGAGTTVTYAVDLMPHGLIARALSHVMDFSALHSRHMWPVLEGLAREAETRSS